MKGKAILAALATGVAGLAAALAMTAAPDAHAATIDQLPGLGYSVSITNLCAGFPCVATGCHDYAASGFGASVDFGSDCDPAFQTNLDTFVAGHDERKLAYQHPDAVAARADLRTKGYTVATSYAVPTFHVTGGCGIDSTGDSAGIVALDASLSAAAPCPTLPPPPPTTTDTTTTTAATTTVAAPTVTTAAPATATPDVQTQIDELRAQLDALSARLDLEAKANDAAWAAFSVTLANGGTDADAALAARSAAQNIRYGLPS